MVMVDVSSNTYNVFDDDLFEVVVIGGGTCGLSVASRLCEEHPASIYTEEEHSRIHWLKRRGSNVNLVQPKSSKSPVNRRSSSSATSGRFSASDILVIDEVSNGFLGQWNRQFEACQIPFLRSPMFFHTDPANVDGLITYANSQGLEDEDHLMKIDNVVGKEYSKHHLKKMINKRNKSSSSRRPYPIQGPVQDKKGLVDINMRDWRDYYRPSTELFKNFCDEVAQRYNIQDRVVKDKVVDLDYSQILILENGKTGKGFVIKMESGKTICCKSCIIATGHNGTPNYPSSLSKRDELSPNTWCHTRHIFKGSVEFPHQRLLDKVRSKKHTSLAIVGGGQTAAQLVDVALKSGIDKVFLILRGPVKIKHFDFHLDWVTKYRNVKKAGFYIRDSDEERLEVINEAREGGSMNPEYYKKMMDYVDKKRLRLLTYSTIREQIWNKECSSWGLSINTNDSRSKSPKHRSNEEHSISNVDYICYATGVKQDLSTLPFMKNILNKFVIPLVQGFPCLTDNLQWNEDLPLFFLGKNAALRIGPSSANLDGARLGAERIGWYIQSLRARGDLNWDSARECDSHNEEFATVPRSYDKEDSIQKLSSFATRLKLASGEMNWYSILSNIESG